MNVSHTVLCLLQQYAAIGVYIAFLSLQSNPATSDISLKLMLRQDVFRFSALLDLRSIYERPGRRLSLGGHQAIAVREQV